MRNIENENDYQCFKSAFKVKRMESKTKKTEKMKMKTKKMKTRISCLLRVWYHTSSFRLW